MAKMVPKAVIRSTPETRREYFLSRTVLHAKMNDVFTPLWKWMHGNPIELLVFIFGPSGVGKTALRMHAAKEYFKEHLKQLNADREWIPLTQNELDEKSERYSWREFYRGGLEAAKEPLIDKKMLPRGELNKLYVPTGKASIDLWGNAYAESHQKRRVRIAFVDNANMLNEIPRLNKEAVTNPLIGLSRICPHYLFGTYKLFHLRNQNGQIARRARILHFSRYHFADPKENRDFQEALNGFSNHLPFEERPDLVAHAEYIFGNCVGCMGVLHDWLGKALDIAMEENARTLDLRHLQKTRPDDDALRCLKSEVAAGEERYLELEDEYQETRKTLDRVDEKWIERFGEKRDQSGEVSGGSADSHKHAQKGDRQRRKQTRPGRMKPRKLPIGGAVSRLKRQPIAR